MSDVRVITCEYCYTRVIITHLVNWRYAAIHTFYQQ